MRKGERREEGTPERRAGEWEPVWPPGTPSSPDSGRLTSSFLAKILSHRRHSAEGLSRGQGTQLLGDRGASKASPSSHPRNSLSWPWSSDCEPVEVKPEMAGGGEGEGDQDHHSPVSSKFSEAPGIRARARGKEHRANVRMNFLTERSNRAGEQ